MEFTVAGRKLCRSVTGARGYCGPLSYRPQSDRLLRNLGDGVFEDVSGFSGIAHVARAGLGVSSGDFDGDGRMELYVANDRMPNSLWLRGGEWRFRDVALETGSALSGAGQAEAGMGLATADIDGDGDEDILVTHLARETNTLYRNNGSGLFDDESVATGLAGASWPYTGFGASWIDYDNDGWLDLIAVNGAVQIMPELAARHEVYPLAMPNQLFRNLGGGRFAEVSASAGTAFSAAEVSRGVATGDVDNDGDTDLLLANNNGRVRLLVNQVGNENHWVGLRLIGGEPARDMLGAWVGVRRREGDTLWRRARSDGSYLSSSDPRVLVGLGDSAAVEGVEVRWPDGQWEGFEVDVDRYTTLRQGSGTPLVERG